MQLLSSFYFCFCLIYILVFVEESVGKGFIDGCGFVHDSSRARDLTADYRKNLSNISKF